MIQNEAGAHFTKYSSITIHIHNSHLMTISFCFRPTEPIESDVETRGGEYQIAVR